MGRLTLQELRALAPWRWIAEQERTLERLHAALGGVLCAPPRSAWHMRPSRFERRVLQALEMLGVAHVVREVGLSLRTTPAMRRAMAHPASGAFHVPGTVALRLDMVWWDAARGVLRILEVDGAQHAEGPAGGAGHFFFRCDPSVAHRARCRDMIKDALVAGAHTSRRGPAVSLLRIPPALERASHTNNVALIRTLHAWLSGSVGRQAEPPTHFPLPGGEGGSVGSPRPRPRSASLPPLRRPAAVNFEDERRARTAFVRARRAAARTPAEERLWRARQLASDSRKMVRDDTLRPYPPAWWQEARAPPPAGAKEASKMMPAGGAGELQASPEGAQAVWAEEEEEEGPPQQHPAKRRRGAGDGQRV